MKLEHSVEIAAPAALVWQVITDLDRYPEWNPFVVACRSDLAVGSPIEMRVCGLAPWAVTQREEILAHEPGRRLCYGLRGAFLGGISSTRCHLVSARGPDAARYGSSFALRGALEPIVRGLLGGRLAHGFQAMTTALARRAETLAVPARSAAP
jgi:uncharacterized protein YndB with AHSA1/START domain